MCSFLIIYVFFFIAISMPAQAAGQRDFAAGMIERYATKGDEKNTDISSSWIETIAVFMMGILINGLNPTMILQRKMRQTQEMLGT